MSVLELYPQCGRERPVKGLYLAHRLHSLGTEKQPFIYANFVQSLDGRIALDGKLPESLASANDLRLLLELGAQADCLITHGAYLRAIADGRLDDVLQIKETDLIEWREEQGLAPQPAVVVASASLDFELPASLTSGERQVVIATGEGSDAKRIRAWQDRGHEVISAGRERYVEGAPLVAALSKSGFRSCYLLAGPLMLATMARDNVLSHLYLTISHQLVGGESFDTMFRGPALDPPSRFTLASLYYDHDSKTTQWFAQFDCCQDGQGAAR